MNKKEILEILTQLNETISLNLVNFAKNFSKYKNINTIKNGLINFWNKEVYQRVYALFFMNFVLQAQIMRFFALAYIVGSNVAPPALFFTAAYLISNKFIKSKKKETDVTNVNLFDRVLALTGLVLPFLDICRYFPNELERWDFLYEFHVTYFTGLIMLLECNQLIMIGVQVFTYRQIIRRRGPDTEWYSYTPKEGDIWIKYFVRYYWGFGFLLTALLEPYHFIQTKFLPLFNLDESTVPLLNELAFSGFLLVLAHGAVFALIGIPNKLPLLHGACEFHVGKPKKID